MSFGLGRESFNDLANSSFEQPAQQLSEDFWVPEVGDDGQIYYVNTQTGVRSREMPSDDYSQTTPTSATSRAARTDARDSFGTGKRNGTPEPWVKRTADTGVYYYENIVDGSVRWTMPSPTSTPRAVTMNPPQPPTLLVPRSGRPLSLGDPHFSSAVSFIDDRDEMEFEDPEEGGAFMNRLSVYSDDSDALPRSPIANDFSNDFKVTPQQLVAADARHADELQSHLIVPSPPTLGQLCDAVQAAITLVEESVAKKSASSQTTNWNERPESLNPASPETTQMVTAVRNLLYAFISGEDAVGSAIGQPLESALPILKPHQRKVAATLSKLILSLRSLHIQADWSTTTEAIQSDVREMKNVIQAFVGELAQLHAQPEGRPLYGVLVSAKGLAGIGLGSIGAGNAARWTGNGFVDGMKYPSIDLGDDLLPRLEQLHARTIDALSTLSNAVSSGATDAPSVARQALKCLTKFSDYIGDINVANIDVDGQDTHRLSKADSEVYSNSVANARVLVRDLESGLQMVVDESANLLSVCQARHPPDGSRVSAMPLLRQGVDTVAETVRELVQAYKTQKIVAGTRRFSAMGLRIPLSRSATVEPFPEPLRPSAVHPAPPLPPPIQVDYAPQASGSRHHEQAMLPSPSMIISPETATTYDDDMVDMELAFSRGPAARPRVPSDVDASSLFYTGPPKDGSRESDSPEPGDHASEDFSGHSRTTSQPTTLGSLGPPTSTVFPNESNGALPVRDDSKLDVDEDEDDFTSTKSSRRRAPKIKQFFGDDAPQYMLNQMKESPAYLRPDYSPSDIIIHPDGSVRAGTLPALIEHLTMHDFRDALFFNSFLVTFKTFASLDDVVDLLIKRFHITAPDGLTSDQLREWQEQKQTVVRIRVINTIKSMLGDEDVITKDDSVALDTIEDFAADAGQILAPAKHLVALVERVRMGGNSAARMIAYTPHDPPPSIIPKNIKKIKLLDIDPLELARQMTIMESKLFCTIRASECLQRSQESNGSRIDNIRTIILTSNKIADWVADSILVHDDHRKRAAVIKLFITAAERCRSLQNYSTMAAFVAGLNSPPIRRLKRSWEVLNQRLVTMFDSVDKTLDSGRSFQNYKATLSKVHPPCVPFLGVYLTTLTFIQDGSPDVLKEVNLINFNKRNKSAEVIREIKTFQSKPYNLTPIPAVLSFIDQSISSLKKSADDFWNLSLSLEPREKDDEKMQRLLTESGFL